MSGMCYDPSFYTRGWNNRAVVAMTDTVTLNVTLGPRAFEQFYDNVLASALGHENIHATNKGSKSVGKDELEAWTWELLNAGSTGVPEWYITCEILPGIAHWKAWELASDLEKPMQ